MSRILRPYQVNCIDAIKDTIKKGTKKIVLMLPTGSGKTRVSAEIAAGILRKGNNLAFTCPRIDLCDQTFTEFYKEGIEDTSIVQANNPFFNPSAAIQICSLQTLERRNYFPDVSVVIFDEVHLLRGGIKKYIELYPNAIFIGLSATPWTKGLGDEFDTLIIGDTMKGLMDKGYLSQYRAFAPNIPDLKGITIRNGDYDESQLSKRLRNDNQLTADIVESWKKLHGTDRTLVFATDRNHAKVLQARFVEAGIPAGYQDAFTPSNERKELKEAFHSKEMPILVSVETMIVGVDYDVRCISLCRSTLSESLFVQLFGRGTRLAKPGADPKPYLTFLDHSGTIDKLGRPEDIVYNRLFKYKDDENEPLPPKPQSDELPSESRCPKCSFIKPYRTPVCPSCGFKITPVSKVIEREGELQELLSGAPRQKKGASKVYSMQEKAAFLADLKAYVVQRAAEGKTYSPSFADAKFKDKFGAWPDKAIKNIPPNDKPSVAIMSFIKYSNIKWAKSKKKRGNSESAANAQ